MKLSTLWTNFEEFLLSLNKSTETLQLLDDLNNSIIKDSYGDTVVMENQIITLILDNFDLLVEHNILHYEDDVVEKLAEFLDDNQTQERVKQFLIKSLIGQYYAGYTWEGLEQDNLIIPGLDEDYDEDFVSFYPNTITLEYKGLGIEIFPESDTNNTFTFRIKKDTVSVCSGYLDFDFDTDISAVPFDTEGDISIFEDYKFQEKLMLSIRKNTSLKIFRIVQGSWNISKVKLPKLNKQVNIYDLQNILTVDFNQVINSLEVNGIWEHTSKNIAVKRLS